MANLVEFHGIVSAPPGRVSLVLDLWPTAAGEERLWSETQRAVAVGPGGSVHLLLGQVVPLPDSVFDKYPCWLSVQLLDGPPVARVPLTGASVRLARRVARLEGWVGDPLGPETRGVLERLPSQLRGLRDGFDDLHGRVVSLEGALEGAVGDAAEPVATAARQDGADARLLRVEDELQELVGAPHGDVVLLDARMVAMEARLSALTTAVADLVARLEGGVGRHGD
jgi:hypothetical protein